MQSAFIDLSPGGYLSIYPLSSIYLYALAYIFMKYLVDISTFDVFPIQKLVPKRFGFSIFTIFRDAWCIEQAGVF